jgi:pimeloyl-ACP methyl ester carboxylesterase
MPWLESNGVSLHYRLEGAGERTVALLHEMGGTLGSWDDVVPQLASTFRVLRFDLRGAGLSEKRRGRCGIDDLSDDLEGLLNALGLHQPVGLAGCAVGGAVALHYAAVAPSRVWRLVALAPATVIPEDKKDEIRRLADAIETQGVRSRFADRFDLSYPSHYFIDASRREAARGRLMSNDPHGYAATYRMLAELDMAKDFERIACPALLVAGRHDRGRPPAQVEGIAALIRNARFRVIDSGHAMNVLSPDAVAREILGFFRDDA